MHIRKHICDWSRHNILPLPSFDDLLDSLDGTLSVLVVCSSLDAGIAPLCNSAEWLLPVLGDSDHMRPPLEPLCQSTAMPESPSVVRCPGSDPSTSSSEKGIIFPNLSTTLRLSKVMP